MTSTAMRSAPRRRLRGLAIAGLALAILAACAPRLAAPRRDGDWAATWAASPQPPRAAPLALSDQTVRQVVRVSLGGRRLRVRLSNAFGAGRASLDDVHVAVAGEGGSIQPGTDRRLTFGGRPDLTLQRGQERFSDPVDLPLAPLGRLAVSLHVRAGSAAASEHWQGQETAYLVPGDRAGARDLPGAATLTRRVYLSGVDVAAPAGARVVVALGDSLTDGRASSLDADRRWTDRLAERLAARPSGSPTLVVNAGISGNRLLHDLVGPRALARLDRDVFGQSGVSDLIVFEGINDIGMPGVIGAPGEAVNADAIIGAYRRIIRRAHARGVRVIGATLPPVSASPEQPGFASPANEAKRQAVNRWIRAGGGFDAVIDMDAVLRDPAAPARLRPQFDSGDHLHPNDAGYRAVGDTVDLGLFR